MVALFAVLLAGPVFSETVAKKVWRALDFLPKEVLKFRPQL